MSPSDAVERFLSSGVYDGRFPGWEGNAVERRRRGEATLRDVLRRVVSRAADHAPLGGRAVPRDAEQRVRARVTPLLTGLFPPGEAGTLLELLPPRVVVVAPSTFGAVVEQVPLRTAWDLANLLLDDVGAPPLADDVPELDGLCAAGRAFVLPRALEGDATFPDVVVHEVAHLLHTVPRSELGLAADPDTVLRIPPRRRETFAYACEVWTCALRCGDGEARARALGVWERGDGGPDDDARVDRARLAELLSRAAADPARGFAVLRAWAEGR